MEDILQKATQLGADYADIRFVDRRLESVGLKNGKLDNLSSTADFGFGLRVLVDGGWGYAASSESTPDEMEQVLSDAISIGRASARVQRQPVQLAPVESIRGRYRTETRRDPGSVKLEERLELLKEITGALRSDQRIAVATAYLSQRSEHKLFASTEGSFITQSFWEVGANLSCLAREGAEVQRRSFSDYSQAGFEFIEEMNLPEQAGELADEAIQLLTAVSCPVGVTDMILGSSQLALQIHESCGHPIELDRVLGQEASFAGTSFLTTEKRGSFQYGSPQVTIVADSITSGGLGTFGWDDEGVPAQETVIIDQGRFENYLMSRETASLFGLTSNGTVRADGWQNIPMIRMNNISLRPGDWTLEEIIRDTKRGVLLDTPKSWSLDDKRLNFHFAQEIGWEIEDGAITRVLKNSAYHDMTPHFWNACDAVAGKDQWHLWGLPSCAKGEPVQIAHVAHGAVPARFRNIKVGVDA